MENPSSPLETLRQLKEMLDAGALTPSEFEALKQRLVFMPGSSGSVAAEPVAPAVPAAPVHSIAPALPTPEALPVNHAPASPPAFPGSNLPAVWATPREVEVDAVVSEPVPVPGASAGFPAVVGGLNSVEAEPLVDDNALDPAPAERSSSLGLVLAIGAVLVFLAVVAYLGFTRPASEHISSTSQTAADSRATTIETGPQVAPLPATTAAPETVRVAPKNPAPVIQPRPAVPVADTIGRATTAPAPDSAGKR